MKLLVHVLLCIIPAVMCAPVDFKLDNLKCDVQRMVDVIGADPAEQACEGECHTLLQQGHTLNYACPLVCHGFQNMVQLWHVVPDNTSDPATSKCHNALSHIITTTVPTTTV